MLDNDVEPALLAPPPARVLPARPVLSGFHPDPSVCRVGDTYYLVCSSFEYAPGLPLFRSTDLVTWEPLGHALDRPGQLRLDGVGPSGGVYAPTLRHHDDRFWLVTTNVSDGPGHLLVTAQDPAGPWSDPVYVRAAGGIDPDLAWDDAGTCYLTWSDGGIVQAELDPSTGELLSEPVRLWSGTGGRDPEGPHLYRVGDHWYLMVAEGGTGHGHAVTIARGPSPSGPFEPCPLNPVLTARGVEAAVQNTGHADLVERPDGTWATVFLGVRPAGYFPGWHVLGRETFAAEIAWVDGWPVLGAPIEPSAVPAVEERLAPSVLPRGWVGFGVLPQDVLAWSGERWELTARDGERTFAGRRQEHTRTVTRAEVDGSAGVGGLELRIDPDHALALEVEDGRVRALARIGGLVSVLGEVVLGEVVLGGGDLPGVDLPGADGVRPGRVVLELRTGPSGEPQYSRLRGPDEITAVVHLAEGPVELGRLDGRYLSTEVAGGFTGRMVGLMCADGVLGVERFEHRGTE